MKNTQELSKEIEILQDMFITLLLNASVPQQTVRKIVKVKLKRVSRIGKLMVEGKRNRQ